MYYYYFASKYTYMLPTYCKESEDDHACAHHVGVRILQGKIRWLFLELL